MRFREIDLYLVKSFKMGKANEMCIHKVNFTDGSFDVIWQGQDENWTEKALRHVTCEDAVVYDVVMLSDAELLAIRKVRRSLIVKIKKAHTLHLIFKDFSIFLLFMVVVINLLLIGEFTLGVGLMCAGIIYVGVRGLIISPLSLYKVDLIGKVFLVFSLIGGLLHVAIGVGLFILFLQQY